MNRDLALGGDRVVPSPFLNPALRHAQAADGGSVFDVPTMLRILRQWRWVVLGAAVAGLLAGLMVTLVTKPMYRAGVTLHLSDEQSALSLADVVADRLACRARLPEDTEEIVAELERNAQRAA